MLNKSRNLTTDYGFNLPCSMVPSTSSFSVSHMCSRYEAVRFPLEAELFSKKKQILHRMRGSQY